MELGKYILLKALIVLLVASSIRVGDMRCMQSLECTVEKTPSSVMMSFLKQL
ncbi:hypothetical protein H0W26_00240, partial [Candidatus Dependentiae bacterium]|nr:hypothetical protein [Candidatus Dependentiae bacterium]